MSLVALGSSGCVARAYFTDGTSVSMGRADAGILRGGRLLATEGRGYVQPRLWVERGRRYGTDELVSAVVRAAGTVEDRYPGSLLGVGDLSGRGGGRTAMHKSHANGRDADLIFYSVDDLGSPLPPANGMPRYDRHLISHPPRELSDGGEVPSRRIFDVARNWALVAALVSDDSIQVEYLFIAEKLRRQLLEHAAILGEPSALIDRAARALRQPRRALPHDDHLHLRIRCPTSDLFQGCVDEGRVRLRTERVVPKIS